MAGVYTVAQANTYIKNMFTQDYLLNNISVKGEVSNCTYHTSGHIYFSLKDAGGVLSCVMFAGKRKGLNFKMSEGDSVIVSGRIGVYERDGKYQLYAEKIQNAGEGELYRKFIELKNELEEMGMFDEMYKKSIPNFAMNIGIITSATGAAIKDIVNVATRRNPYVRLRLYNARVQGDGAAKEIVKGIRYMDRLGFDVLIVGRGGGSIEDLWCFNDKNIAKAIFECNTPVISAVGHERDFTICDFVADLRAATPSAAAELAVFEYDNFIKKLQNYEAVMKNSLVRKLESKRLILNQYKWQLERRSPEALLNDKRQRLADDESILLEIMKRKILLLQHRLSINSERLNGLSPLNRLSKGFAYVQDKNGTKLTDISQLDIGDEVSIQVRNGTAKAEIKGVEYGKD